MQSTFSQDQYLRYKKVGMMKKSVRTRMTLIAIAISVSTISIGAISSATTSESGGFVQIDDSKNISQLIRSNSNHYWNFMKKEADLTSLKKYIDFEGFVTGDPHLGNFAVMPVTTNSGERKFAFLDIDFDDAGHAPFVLDFTRLMVALKAVSKDIKAEEMVQAYLSGLQGKTMDAPDEIAAGLATDVSEYESKVQKYVEKRVINDHFDAEAAEVAVYSGIIKASELEKFFPGQTILDIGLKKKDRGGSQDSLRLWILVGAKDGTRKIFELKEWDRSGTSYFEHQALPLKWAESVYKTFRIGVDPSDYKLVNVGTAGLFWLRQKKVNVVKVDYNGKSSESQDYARRLGIYDCWYLGKIHGGQVGAKAYTAAIHKDVSAFKEAVKAVAKNYLSKALAALDSVQ